MRHVIKVPDISCRHCQMKISEALRGLAGIRSLVVDLEKKEVRLDSEWSRDQVLEKIREIGYHPE